MREKVEFPKHRGMALKLAEFSCFFGGQINNFFIEFFIGFWELWLTKFIRKFRLVFGTKLGTPKNMPKLSLLARQFYEYIRFF